MSSASVGNFILLKVMKRASSPCTINNLVYLRLRVAIIGTLGKYVPLRVVTYFPSD